MHLVGFNSFKLCKCMVLATKKEKKYFNNFPGIPEGDHRSNFGNLRPVRLRKQTLVYHEFIL
jgi:hypothetical protein